MVDKDLRRRVIRTPRDILRQYLDDIDGFLNRDDEAAALLWDVLSALRGPDITVVYGSPEHTVMDLTKKATTAVLRRKAFPRTFGNESFTISTLCVNKAIGLPDNAGRLYVRKSFDLEERVGVHFLKHYEYAFAALGLKTDEVNND